MQMTGDAGRTRRDVLRAGGSVAAVGAGVGTAATVGTTGVAAQETGSGALRQTERLAHPDDQAGEFDLFGLSVDSDDDRVLVGAPLQDSAETDAGAAYLFRDDGDEWTLQHRFDAGDDARPGARFGNGVAVDGDTVLVGAAADSEVGRDAGAAYVFELDGEEWTRVQKLLPTSFDEEWEVGPVFGWRVAMEGDVALVSAPSNSDFDTASGVVTVFERASGGRWEATDTLYPEESATTHPFYLVEFGYSIALSGDRILVGAPGDHETAPDAGAAYVFEPGADGWDRQRKLLAAEPDSSARFGYAVAVDGDRALVGAPFNEGEANDSYHGTAHLYARGDGEWGLETQFSVSETADAPGGWFGYDVGLSEDTATVTRPNASGDEATDSGAAYVFDRDGDSWSRRQRLVADDPENGELFGVAVEAHEARTVVTDSWYTGPAPQSGTAYVFEAGETTSEGGPGFGVVGVAAAVALFVFRAVTGRRPNAE